MRGWHNVSLTLLTLHCQLPHFLWVENMSLIFIHASVPKFLSTRRSLLSTLRLSLQLRLPWMTHSFHFGNTTPCIPIPGTTLSFVSGTINYLLFNDSPFGERDGGELCEKVSVSADISAAATESISRRQLMGPIAFHWQTQLRLKWEPVKVNMPHGPCARCVHPQWPDI